MRKILQILLMSVFVCFAWGQSEYIHDKIIVFKDGTAFFQKHTFADVIDGEVILNPIPFSILEKGDQSYYSRSNNAEKRIVMGSLRFMALNNAVTQANYSDNLESELSPDYSIDGMLLSNIGQMVSLRIKEQKDIITGEILSLIEADKKVTIKGDRSYFYVLIKNIERINFQQKAIIQYKVHNTFTKTISLNLDKDTKNQKINISYLQKGMTWMPNYFIDIAPNNNLELSLFANLVNNIEDIKNAEVNFVVGIPAFYFSYVSSPMASDKDILQILSDLNNPPKGSKSGIHPTMSQRGLRHTVNFGTNYQPQLEGKSEEDMFFYVKKNASIQKNASLLIPIFSSKINYTDIYLTDLKTNLNPSNDEFIDSKDDNRTWHAIRFKNTTGFPLTTGSVFFDKKNRNNNTSLLSQNMIDFTPANEFARVKMAISPDIVVTQEDTELDQEDSHYGSYFDKYQMEGKITIINYKSKPIEMEINRVIYGDMKSSSIEYEHITTYGTSKNKKNNVTWKLTIPTGEMVNISYQYEVIAR